MSHQNITYSNSYLIRSMEMFLTVFTMDSEKSVRCFSILFLHFLWKNRVKTCVTLKYYILQLLLDEEHGDVLDHVHHWLLEVRERVFDIIFAFLMKNWGKNICHIEISCTRTPTRWGAWRCPWQCSPWALRSQGGCFRYQFCIPRK